MKMKLVACGVFCVLILAVGASAAHHEESEALIELDKKWGSSVREDAEAVLGEILADDLIGITGAGPQNKDDMVAAATSDDAPASPYVAGDYAVRFLDDDTAVMVHSAGEPDPHWSMHVWQKRDGKWQVVATASTPIEE